MESVERYTQNQRIIEEFTAHWLAGIRSNLGRLVYVAMLRDVSTGRYRHPALEEFFPEGAVHQALHYCHEELFKKFLEASLECQEWDLRAWFATMNGNPAEIAGRWLEMEFYRQVVPFGTPPYLRDLLFSNLRVILGMIVAERMAV